MCYGLQKREKRQDRDEAFFLTAATAFGIAVGLALVAAMLVAAMLVAAMLVSSIKKTAHEERVRDQGAAVFRIFKPTYHVRGA